MSAARFLVGGKVQGVWFRAATREQAHVLGLRGHAKNLADGRVEVLAIGDDDELDALETWLWQGPPLAKVSEVRREAIAAEPDVQGFVTD